LRCSWVSLQHRGPDFMRPFMEPVPTSWRPFLRPYRRASMCDPLLFAVQTGFSFRELRGFPSLFFLSRHPVPPSPFVNTTASLPFLSSLPLFNFRSLPLPIGFRINSSLLPYLAPDLRWIPLLPVCLHREKSLNQNQRSS
jgi:hypothetical protein